MRVEVEPLHNGMVSLHAREQMCRRPRSTYRHQDDSVDAQPPLFGEHGSHLSPEDACADALVPSSLPVTELFRLGECDAYQTYTNRQASRDPLFNLQLALCRK